MAAAPRPQTFDEEQLRWLGDEPDAVRAADTQRIRNITAEYACNIALRTEQRLDAYVDIGMRFRHFSARKVMFVRYLPVILIGEGEWDGLLESRS